MTLKNVASDQNGNFSFPNVPPGDNKVFRWEAAEPGATYDPDFVRDHETQGALVHAVEGSIATANVKCIPAP